MNTLWKQKRAMLALTWFVGLTCASGCMDMETHDDPPEGAAVIAERSSAIKGGQVDSDNVAILGIASLQNGGLGICTGTLIAPNLVLTAQHCVAENLSQFAICGNEAFGDTFDAQNLYFTSDTNISQNGNFFVGAEVYVPDGANDICGFDIALVRLRDNIPSDIAVPVVPRIDSRPERGEIYTAVGYGSTNDRSGSGVRRVLGDRSIDCFGDACGFGITDREFEGDEGTCQGDSGGPALDEYGRVLGALSRGQQGCRSSVYSSVYSWSGWMRRIGRDAAELGGYEAPGWVTLGTSTYILDVDEDGVRVNEDNCPDIANADQSDFDGDGIGDICDADIEGDTIDDDFDNCPDVANTDQADLDGDGRGDACDDDTDGDTIANDADNCPFAANTDQADADNDGVGNFCDDDADGDTIANDADNCPLVANADQSDVDGDGVGDACTGGSGSSGFVSNGSNDPSCSTLDLNPAPSRPLAPLSALGMLALGWVVMRRKR